MIYQIILVVNGNFQLVPVIIVKVEVKLLSNEDTLLYTYIYRSFSEAHENFLGIKNILKRV